MVFYPCYPQPLNPYPQTPVQSYQDRLAQLQNNYQQTTLRQQMKTDLTKLLQQMN